MTNIVTYVLLVFICPTRSKALGCCILLLLLLLFIAEPSRSGLKWLRNECMNEYWLLLLLVIVYPPSLISAWSVAAAAFWVRWAGGEESLLPELGNWSQLQKKYKSLVDLLCSRWVLQASRMHIIIWNTISGPTAPHWIVLESPRDSNACYSLSSTDNLKALRFNSSGRTTKIF